MLIFHLNLCLYIYTYCLGKLPHYACIHVLLLKRLEVAAKINHQPITLNNHNTRLSTNCSDCSLIITHSPCHRNCNHKNTHIISYNYITPIYLWLSWSFCFILGHPHPETHHRCGHRGRWRRVPPASVEDILHQLANHGIVRG